MTKRLEEIKGRTFVVELPKPPELTPSLRIYLSQREQDVNYLISRLESAEQVIEFYADSKSVMGRFAYEGGGQKARDWLKEWE